MPAGPAGGVLDDEPSAAAGDGGGERLVLGGDAADGSQGGIDRGLPLGASLSRGHLPAEEGLGMIHGLEDLDRLVPTETGGGGADLAEIGEDRIVHELAQGAPQLLRSRLEDS